MVVCQVDSRRAKLLIRETKDGSRNASRAPKSASTAAGIEVSCTTKPFVRQ